MRPNLPSTLSLLLLCLAEALVLARPAQAADWLTVASDRVRRVELDRASIMASDAGSKVAWGRIVLSDEQAKAYGYRTVRALNRYDCRAHAFIIVTRVYLSGDDTVLREDKVDATAPISVKTGTVDDRFFNEVCKPASVAQLRDVAKKAAEGITKADEPGKPMVRRADIQLAKDESPAQAAPPMAENKAPARPVEKAPVPVVTPKSEAHLSSPERRPSLDARAATRPETAVEPRTDPRNQKTAMANATASTTLAIRRREAELLAAERASAQAALQVATASTRRSAAPAIAMRRATVPNPPRVLDEQDLHWSYEGKNGPENWGKLDPEFSVCTNGKRQSPIDIRDGIKVDQEPIQFDYKPTYFRIVDNGHTVQVSYGPGSHITVMGRTYDLIQFHFHHPAEERIDGKGFAMVAHLVHRDQEGRLAVVAVLLEAGQANSIIQTLWNNLPLEQNEDYSPRVSIQVADLLPASRGYISYIGSLTTPPCTEGVLWLVLKQPVQISAEQIDVFSRFYPNNARPLQAASGRIIKDSR